MVGRGTMGLAPRNGAISRLGDCAKEHPVLPVLSVIHFLLFELGRGTARPASDGFDTAPAAGWRPPLLGVIGSFPFLLRVGDVKQTFRGHVARRACAVPLVAARADRMERCSTPRSISVDLSHRECVDNLGTEISRIRCWSRVGAELVRASDHRRTSDVVLPGEASLA